MSTSILYHGFGIRGYRYWRTVYENGEVAFWIHQETETLRCSMCHSSRVICRGQNLRWFRTIPIGRKSVFVVLPVQRVECRACERVRQVNIAFADRRRSYTRAFERYALELSRHMTILDVARHLNVSWDIIKDIQKRYLEKRFAHPRLKDLKRIAIDEIHIGSGYRYLTIVLDLVTGAVVFVGEGKGAEALEPFWRRLKLSGASIKAVAMDMSQAYISAVHANLPGVRIVFDHFHLIKLFNEKLSKLRWDLQREAEDSLQKHVLKGTRWLLLKNPENLDGKRKEQERLEEALRINRPLAIAYYLKEDLRQLWSQPDKQTASRFLTDWISTALSSDVSMLQQFAKTLAVHRRGILAYYDYPISTGPLEGTNNKIRTLQRQAYGFRDREFFKLKIYGLHETKYALVG